MLQRLSKEPGWETEKKLLKKDVEIILKTEEGSKWLLTKWRNSLTKFVGSEKNFKK